LKIKFPGIISLNLLSINHSKKWLNKKKFNHKNQKSGPEHQGYKIFSVIDNFSTVNHQEFYLDFLPLKREDYFMIDEFLKKALEV